MAGSVKGLVIELGGDTSGLQKALSDVNKKTSSLNKELRGINSLLKLDPKNTELLAQKQTVLSKNIENTSDKLKQLKEIQSKFIKENGDVNSENYRALQREIINTESKLDNLVEHSSQKYKILNESIIDTQNELKTLKNTQTDFLTTDGYKALQSQIEHTENRLKELQAQASKWTQAGQSLDAFSEKVGKISEKINNIGNTLTAKLTLPIATVATAAIKTGTDFEQEMSRVQAISQASKDELEKMTNQAIELGAKTVFSSKEAADGMENLASAGFSVNEIMEAMPGMLDLAASSGADLATSSEIAASTIRGFGLEANTAGHIADVFAMAAAKTNAQTEDMGEAMKYVAPVAKTVGLTVEETAAAIGIMSDAGVKGSQAGTTLRSGLARIIKPTKQVYMAMDRLGVSFYDNNGKMKSLKDIIGELQRSTNGLTDETKNWALAQIFGTEALSGMMALVNRGSDELDSMTKSFESCDGAAAEMSETMLDNTAGSIEALKGSLESAGIVIQRALSPYIRKLTKNIQNLVDNFSNLSSKEQQNIIKTAALVASIGPAIKIIAKIGNGIKGVTGVAATCSKAIGLIGKTGTASFATASTGTKILASGLTALLSPAGLITTSLLVAGGAAIYFATRQTEAGKKAKELAETVNTTKQSLDDLNKSTNDATESNLAHINYCEQLKEELKTLVDENGKVKEGYKTRVQFILTELNSALGTEYKLNGDIIKQYNNLRDEIDKTIEKQRAQIKLEGEKEKYSNWEKTETEAVNNYKQALETATETMKKYHDSSISELRARKDSIPTWSSEYKEISKVIEAYDNSINTIKTGVADKEQYENDYALFLEGKYGEIGNTITGATKDWNSENIDTISQSLKEQGDLYNQWANIAADTSSDVAKNNENQYKKQIEDLANNLVQRTQTLNTLSPQEVNAWYQLSQADYETYKSALSKMPPEMQNKINEAVGNATANRPAMERAGFILGDGFSSNVGQSVKRNIKGYEWGSDLPDEFSKGVTSPDSKRKTTSAVEKFCNWISERIHFSVPDKGPLADADTYMPDMIKLFASGIDKNKYKIVDSIKSMSGEMNNALNFGKIQAGLKNNIIKENKTIFTTPNLTIYTQEFDARKIANEVNKVFGSQY